MIELKATGKCDGCPEIDVEFSRMKLGEFVMFSARCKYAGLCDRLETRLREGIQAENERAVRESP